MRTMQAAAPRTIVGLHASDSVRDRFSAFTSVAGHRDAVHAGAVTIAFNSTTCVIKWADGSRTVCAGGTRARAIKMN